MNIESRVAKLEAQNRLFKGVAVTALAVAALPWVMGSEAAIQDHVQARRFTLIGNGETPVGSWSFDEPTGTATLHIQPSGASPSVTLKSSVDSSTVRLHDGVKRPPETAGVEDVVLTAGKGDTAINVQEGFITIARQGKTAFVVPPRSTFLPVTQK